LIIGDNEIAAGKYALKNMQSGEQESVERLRNRGAYSLMPISNPVAIPIEDHTVAGLQVAASRLVSMPGAPNRRCIQRREERRDESRRRRHECPRHE